MLHPPAFADPAATAPRAAAPPSVTLSAFASAAPNGAPRTTILVVDDRPVGAVATRGVLTAGGYASRAVPDGAAALRLARASRTCLVISELYMPCGEGPCLVAALKGDRARLSGLAVLVHTRHTGAADRSWALAAGADTVVPKFARPGVLLREVRRLDGGAPVVGAGPAPAPPAVSA